LDVGDDSLSGRGSLVKVSDQGEADATDT